jgi:hypothetical protein
VISVVSAVCRAVRTSKKVSFGLKVGSESLEPSPCASSEFDGPFYLDRSFFVSESKHFN